MMAWAVAIGATRPFSAICSPCRWRPASPARWRSLPACSSPPPCSSPRARPRQPLAAEPGAGGADCGGGCAGAAVSGGGDGVRVQGGQGQASGERGRQPAEVSAGWLRRAGSPAGGCFAAAGSTRDALGELQLTAAGRAAARSLVRAHRLWESYLDTHFDLPRDHLHDAAERMEHFLGAELQEELAAELAGRAVDPHGKAIPPASQSATNTGDGRLSAADRWPSRRERIGHAGRSPETRFGPGYFAQPQCGLTTRHGTLTTLRPRTCRANLLAHDFLLHQHLLISRAIALGTVVAAQPCDEKAEQRRQLCRQNGTSLHFIDRLLDLLHLRHQPAAVRDARPDRRSACCRSAGMALRTVQGRRAVGRGSQGPSRAARRQRAKMRVYVQRVLDDVRLGAACRSQFVDLRSQKSWANRIPQP